MISNITIEEVLQKKEKNIIDIRDVSAYLKGHIENAKSIPKSLLLESPERYLDKSQIYYIYCYSGVQSMKVVQALRQRGYHVKNILGGYHNYLLRK